MDTILDDYQHRVEAQIAAHDGEAGFPRMDDYGFTRDDLDDYLFDVQAIMDSEGSQKTQYTVMGFFIVLPVLIFSAVPDDKMPGGSDWGLFVAIAFGLVLALLVKCLIKLVIRLRLRNRADKNIDRYISDIFKYRKDGTA